VVIRQRNTLRLDWRWPAKVIDCSVTLSTGTFQPAGHPKRSSTISLASVSAGVGTEGVDAQEMKSADAAQATARRTDMDSLQRSLFESEPFRSRERNR
jgi:hypothetical protein